MPSTNRDAAARDGSETITVAGHSVEPGERRRVEIPVSRLPTETWMSVPVEIVNGARTGPNLWLSAAIHGDEINGIEIIRRVLERLDPAHLRGAVIAVPIVNVFGYLNQSRYLPDRRDLNRCFPGSSKGSMGSRLANLFMREIVSQCSLGIDLHTGSNHRTNMPQIRANLHDAETRRLAELFGPPVIMHSESRDGSLREAATRRGIHVLLYEAGEPLRFDEEAIRVGTNGTLRVMSRLGMRQSSPKRRQTPPIELESSQWIRARRSGILRLDVQLGLSVTKRQPLGVITDAFGDNAAKVIAPHDGLIIGHVNNPVVNQGDGIINLGQVATEAGGDER